MDAALTPAPNAGPLTEKGTEAWPHVSAILGELT